MNFTAELIEKAKQAKTVEELQELAKAENIELSAEEAARYFAELHKTGELSDEELDNVAGGCGDDEDKNKNTRKCPDCGSTNFRFLDSKWEGSKCFDKILCKDCGRTFWHETIWYR